MGIKADWFGLAEGAATDARGSITLVGFSPDVFVLPELPGPQNLILVLIVRDDEDPEPIFKEKAQVSIDVQVYSPDGKILGGMQQPGNLAAKRYPELPGAAILTTGMRLTFQQYGEHKATMSFSVGTSEIKAERKFYILPK
jgi:hypothetical protein